MEQLMSLSKIFTEKLYRIPDYQRGYAWSVKEAEDLWNDLNRLNMDKKYYIGVITLEKVKEDIYKNWYDDLWIIKSKSYQPYYVVDGQQRLTTSIILIQCILEKMSIDHIESLNYDTIEDITKKYIYQSKPENLSKSYLFSYENGNPSLKFWTQEILDNLNDAENMKEKTMYTSNLLKIKEFFKDKIKDCNKELLEKVYSKLTQSFLFNIYEITDDIDVFVAFESMNNRGKRLSILELLKNRLIYLSTLFNVEDDIKSRMRIDINSCWKTLYAQLGINPENPLSDDEFLSAHYTLHFHDTYYEERKKLGGTLRNIDNIDFDRLRPKYILDKIFVPERIEDGTLITNDIFSYINSLEKSVKVWSNLRNPKISMWNSDIQVLLNKINYLNSYTYMSFDVPSQMVLILKILQEETNQIKIKRFLKAIERFDYIKLFYQYETISDHLKDFDEEELISITCKGSYTIDNIIEKYEKKSNEIITSQLTYSRLLKLYSKSSFYNNKRLIFYTLSDYELKLMNESKSPQKVNNALLGDRNFATIEHIYPQRTSGTYWINLYKKYPTKQKNRLKNTIGNFVLVSELKNSKLSNKSFPEKKENCENVVGYKYGSFTEIEICKNNDWGAKEILERGIKLLVFIKERWGLNIKKSDYKKILGLEFLKF